jgi:hypothetical protein
MMDLISSGGRSSHDRHRGFMVDLGWTTVSITAALVLLPAIGMKALVHSFPFVKKRSDVGTEPPSSSFIT